MKANEVLSLLRITRPTLTKYVKSGIIKAVPLPNGRYEYDSDSVYMFLNKGVKRKTYIYARVASSKHEDILNEQVERLRQFCFANGYTVSGIYKDVASGVHFNKRVGFFAMLDDVLDNKVERVVIMYKDRLSRTCFDLCKCLFEQHRCTIEVMSDEGSENLDRSEIKNDVTEFLSNYAESVVSQLYTDKK